MIAVNLMRDHRCAIDGIIHVGANTGLEAEDYYTCGASTCLYVEPIPHIFQSLQKNISKYQTHFAVNALCSNVDGEELQFNVSNNTGSSSIFRLGRHAEIYPETKYVDGFRMRTETLDRIVHSQFPSTRFSLLVIDTQGAELKVLQGAKTVLQMVDGVFVEVSEIPLYEHGCTFNEVTEFLRSFGFWPKWLSIGRKRWGDAFYLSDRCFEAPDRVEILAPSENLALNRRARQSSLSKWSHSDDAQGAVNGIRTGRYGFCTDIEDNPWWEVDLGTSKPIAEIRVYNRLEDGWGDRARTLLILLSLDGSSWWEVHNQAGRTFGGIDGRPLRAIFDSALTARFVRLQLNERQYLHLDEVEVYGPSLPKNND
jgi:FkbM family methyltransferase